MKVTGSLQIKSGTYYTVMRVPTVEGKIKQKWQSTKIPADGKTKRERDRNLKKANKILQKVILECEEKSALESDKMFTAWVDDWLEHVKTTVRLNTWEAYEMYAKTHIKPYFAPLKLKINEVTPRHIQKYIDEKYKAGQSANSIKHHMRVLNGVFKMAVSFNAVPYNPCDRVSLPKIKKHIGRAYTPEQVKLLLQAVENDPLKPAVMLGLFLGLRRSEILGLRWKDIDFENDIVRIRNTIVRTKTLIEHEQTKSKASRRDLPLPASLKAYLLELREHQLEMASVLKDAYVDTEHVCKWDDGTPFKPDYPTNHFRKILEKNNLPIITFHELRHTAGSILINAGQDVKRVQEFLGHEEISTTLDIYTHLTAETRRETADVLDNLLTSK